MEPLLSLTNVSLRYAPSQVLALTDVTLEVGEGEYVAIWGPRRSGRSSLLAVAAGLIEPTSGSVLFDGKPPFGSLGRPQGIGWAVDDPYAFPPSGGATVFEQACWPSKGVAPPMQVRRRADELLIRCGIGDLAGMSPWQLSHDERVRLLLVRSLVRMPRLLLLDEPTAGATGPEARKLSALLRSLVREDGVAVLVTTDEPEALEYTRPVSLQRGVMRAPRLVPRGDVLDFEARRSSR